MSFLRAFLRPVADFIPVLAILLFLGALFWAKGQDPFSRQWFTVLAGGHACKCVAVLPKPIRPCPVVIYAHGSGGTLMTDGFDLRQMAELGLAVVSVEYDQTNELAFPTEMAAVRQYLDHQKWADTNAIAWAGFSMGANRMLDFARQHPDQLPRLLIQLSGASQPGDQPPRRLGSLPCPVLLLHGGEDEIFPVADTLRLASALQSNGVPVAVKIIPGLPHGLEPERGVVFRAIGEYCLSKLAGRDAWSKYHSIAQWQAEAPALVWFWLPAGAWAVGWFVWKRRERPAQAEKRKLQWHEIALRWLAALLAVWAAVETGLHLITPHFAVGTKTLSIARRMLVQDKELSDFQFLSAQPVWEGQRLKTLLDHVELAGYNRELINWQLDNQVYRDFVLSPSITGGSGEQLNWRRPLWEEFYPRIRHESSPIDAARIVVRHLRERVTVLAQPNLPHAVPDIWRRQITDPAGFEIIYVAALRCAGVPARLDTTGQAEMFADGQWQPAPRPVIFEAI